MTAYQKLETIFEKISHLQHLQAITGWDEAVMMPMGGGAARAAALATLNGVIHQTLTAPEVPEFINQAKNENLENSWQQANLKKIEKKYLYASCVPTELVKKHTEACITSEQAWRKLRAENNWRDFIPLLENTLSYTKEIAQIRAAALKKSPYDVMLDDFSPDIHQAMLDPLFTELKKTLPPLIEQVANKQKLETVVTPNGPFNIEKQKLLGIALMSTLGFDFNHGRLDMSHHPFCGGVPQDVRITTRYNENEFITAGMGICHETGHAKYEQQLPQQWLNQPVGQALGMAVHESQSLLIEMQACRSLEFMQFLSPLVEDHFGRHVAFSAENLHRLYTRVKPIFIRVDSDELTYPLHIILRYEIEKELIEGGLKVKDLPELWDQKMTQYLNLSTNNNYKNGVMQDVHWPAGLFGYFPAYTLGALTAAQLFAAAKRQHPDLLSSMSRGDFSTLFAWLKEHVHSRGSSVSFDQLLIDATGEKLNAAFFINHITKRYL